MTIVKFGQRDRLSFRCEGALSEWKPEVVPAVFAITYKKDPGLRPKSHTVLFFGEVDNLAMQAGTICNDFRQWGQDINDSSELFVFTYPMPGSSKYERGRVAQQLIAEYDPLANN